MKRFLLAALAAVSLLSTAHAASLPAAQPDPFSVLKNFTVDDLNNALADATANNDTIAATCYQALIPIVQAANLPAPSGKFGVFMALQKARDVVNKVNQVQANIGPIADAKNKCAAVILDTQQFLIRLGVLGAGAAIKPF